MGRFTIFFIVSPVLLSLAASQSYAQDTLKQVTVKDKRALTRNEKLESLSVGVTQERVDSLRKQLYAQQSLANLLMQQSAVFVKTYGVNTLATVSLRGASAAQTAVMWNGFNINNAALGVTDLSQMQLSMFDDIHIQHSASGAILGNATIGGALLLDDNAPSFKKYQQLNVSGGYGSWQAMQGGLQYALGTNISETRIKFAYAQAANDFKYFNPDVQEWKRQSHAQTKGYNILLSQALKAGKRDQLSFKYWMQDNNRELPPLLSQKTSEAVQRTKNIRATLQWQHDFKASQLQAAAAYFNEKLYYDDGSINLHTLSPVQTGEAYVQWKKETAQHYVLVGTDSRYSVWNGVNQAEQRRVAGFFHYRFTTVNEKIKVLASVRAENWATNYTEVLPGINLSYSPAKWINVYGNVQKSLRMPTLAELYTYPGGNAQLRPEKGWGQEIGLNYNVPLTKELVLSGNWSVFNRNIQDWIVWFGGAVWTPHNISKVHSRGLETTNKLTWNRHEWMAELGLNTAYILSTTEESLIPYDNSIGKQIPYVPRYSGVASLTVGYRSFRLLFSQSYTGYRFYNTDETGAIAPYTVANLHLLYGFKVAGKPWKIMGQINNLFNASYAVMYDRPMPLRSYGISLQAGIL